MTLAKKVKDIEEEELKAQACKISIKEGSAYSISDGFGFKYITPYALALGSNNTQIGLLASIPNLIGSFSTLGGVHLMKETSRKKIVSVGVFIQALMWLALIAVGVLFFILGVDSDIAPMLLIIIYTLLVLAGSVTGPAWNSWMKDVIPEKYGQYFGTRNRAVGVVSLIAMLIAGFILDYFKKTYIFAGFMILFFVAFIGRSISAYLFTRTHEPKFNSSKTSHMTFLSFIKKIYRNNFGKFTLYISLLTFAVAISSPFFAVYMLKYLNFSYTMYTVVIILPLVMRFIVLPAWGRFADIYGNLKIMRITGMIVPLIPLYWFLVPVIARINQSFVFPYILVLETFVSGFAWAGFDTGNANFMFDSSTRDNMPVFSAYFSIINNIGYFIGALLGGILSSIPFTVFGLSSILFVFLLSGVARFAMSIIMLPKIKEVKKVQELDGVHLRQIVFHLTPHDIIKMLR